MGSEGCPRFAKAYLAEKDGAKPHDRFWLEEWSAYDPVTKVRLPSFV